MTLAATRAEAVAKILWELKRAEKLATLSSIAERAGFSPGSGGRTMHTCIKTVRRDWPHLQWWRAVSDDGVIDQEQQKHLDEAGFETEAAEGETGLVKELDEKCMVWEVPEPTADEAEAV